MPVQPAHIALLETSEAITAVDDALVWAHELGGLPSPTYHLQAKKVGQMTYSRFRKVVREALCRLGEQPDDYGLHSFRAEGATAAANAGVKDGSGSSYIKIFRFVFINLYLLPSLNVGPSYVSAFSLPSNCYLTLSCCCCKPCFNK